MGGISIWQLLIIAVIVVLLFGTNKLKNLGSDLGASIKGFKKAMEDEKQPGKTNKDADFNTQSIQNNTSTSAQTEVEKDKNQV
jgi:sec-independent protein translocase protein TatA